MGSIRRVLRVLLEIECAGSKRTGGVRFASRHFHGCRCRLFVPQDDQDLAGTIIPAGNDALRLLSYYADGLLNDENLRDPAVLAHAGQSLVDLAVLAFGTDRDNTEIARLRGLRAARLATVLRLIRADYADPEI